MFFYHSDGDDTLLSCVKLTKSQEKKEVNMCIRKREEPNTKPESLPVPGGKTSTSNGHILQDTVSPYEAGVPVWRKWEPFSENQLWTSDDFLVAQVDQWGGYCSCSHHLRLKSSYTDTDLLNTWVSFFFLNHKYIICTSMEKQITRVLNSHINYDHENHQSWGRHSKEQMHTCGF